MKKYLITMEDRYLTHNEANAMIEIFNSIEELQNQFKIRKIGYEAYTIKIDTKLEKYLVQILNIVNECDGKVYSTKKSYINLARNQELKMKKMKLNIN